MGEGVIVYISLLCHFHACTCRYGGSKLERGFMDWCLAKGARLDNVVFPMSFGGERGVGTARAVAAGDPLLSVPKALMVTAKRVQDRATGTRFGDLLHALFTDEEWHKGIGDDDDDADDSKDQGGEDDDEDELASMESSEFEEEDENENARSAAAHGEIEETFLALFLAHEKLKGAASDWAPWIDVLPSDYPTVLVCWSKEEVRCRQSMV